MATTLKPTESQTNSEEASQSLTEQFAVAARQLSARDSEQLVHSLSEPPAPSSRLIEAAARYRATQKGD